MKTFLKIAWRNVLRNKRRSIITFSAVSLGLAVLIFFQSLNEGSLDLIINGIIESGVGHIQIHHRGFHKEPSIEIAVEYPEEILKQLERFSEIKAKTERIKTGGLITSSAKSTATAIWGIDPEQESKLAQLGDQIIKGNYLNQSDSHQVLIGKDLAEFLQVDVSDKIVLFTQGADGSLANEAYRVKGILQTNSPLLDRGTAFLTLADAQQLTVLGNKVSEIVMLISNSDLSTQVANRIRAALPESLEVLSWQEAAPYLIQGIEIRRAFALILALIVFSITALGIMNTFVMAIFERIHELGVMMAIGTKPQQIIWMVIAEAVFLASLGIFFGTIIGLSVASYYSVHGIDLGSLTNIPKGLGLNVKIGSIMYSKIIPQQVINFIVLVFLTTIVAVLYPAIKAARLKPVEAIRFI